MPFYFEPDGLRARKLAPVKTFYVDDSSCMIGGIRHTLLGAVGFWDESAALSEFVRVRRELGLRPRQEIKWNSNEFTEELRHSITEGILPILSRCKGFLTGSENGRQHAAVELATQLSDFCRNEGHAGFLCRFDRDIVNDSDAFDRHAYNLDPPCVGWGDSDSAHEPLVQCADLFVGFQKLRIDMGVGRIDPNKSVDVEVYEGTRAGYSLGWYLHMAFRHCLWGSLEESPQASYQWKNNIGVGVRLFSSATEPELNQALAHLGRDYLGCMH